MDKITIASLNCQGLGDFKKRRDVFKYLREKNYSIIFLQDTHFSKQMENIVSSEWGYKIIFSSFKTNSRGVAVLFRNNFEFTLHNHCHDQNGNFIVLDLTVSNQRLTLVNLYGPNKDTPDFYNKLKNIVVRQGNTNILMGGDWNLLLDPAIDGRNYKHINNPNSRQVVLKLMADLKLFDVWREEQGGKSKFTWRRKLNNTTIQMGRLDFFLVSESLLNFTRDENIIPSYRSDHSSITLSLVFGKRQITKTYWKFNNSLLFDTDFIKQIKTTITNTKIQYGATPYNPENINSIDSNSFETQIDSQLFFETLLLEIRNKTISFSSNIKREENQTLNTLEKEIYDLENSTKSEENFELIESKKDVLRAIREKRLKGTLLRSKARWIEEGEKPSSYFCHLENRNFVSKSMKTLISANGEQITDFNLIEKEVFNFLQIPF